MTFPFTMPSETIPVTTVRTLASSFHGFFLEVVFATYSSQYFDVSAEYFRFAIQTLIGCLTFISFFNHEQPVLPHQRRRAWTTSPCLVVRGHSIQTSRLSSLSQILASFTTSPVRAEDQKPLQDENDYSPSQHRFGRIHSRWVSYS